MHLSSQPGPLESSAAADRPSTPVRLEGNFERFDSFWEGPEDIERGYSSFGKFYKANYGRYLPATREGKVLVVSCGPGYFVDYLQKLGFTDVTGIDSDEVKVRHALSRGLPCKFATAFEYLGNSSQIYDTIICEQELNHLTKPEMLAFLRLIYSRISPGGRLICHGLNGANPIVGAETLAQNFDHFNTFTSYSLTQVLEHSGFVNVRVFGLHLYVFYANPANYVAWGITSALSLAFKILFALYGKSNRIFTKKIGAVAMKPLPLA